MPPPRLSRADYRHFVRYASRWRDNDVYGHMNNAVYYEYVDTIVNGWLADHGGLPVPGGEIVCLVAETGCSFHASLGYPDPVDAGLRLERIGTSSITYGVGLFLPDEELEAAGARFVHVCVSRQDHRPSPVPPRLRAALDALR